MNSAPPPRLILASASPRRSDLLREAGYDFEIIKPKVEEIEDPAADVKTLTALNARLKANKVVEFRKESVVLAADTLVLHGDMALGKPENEAEAAAMLARLSGGTHQVYTAVCLVRGATRQTAEFTVTTEVTFKDLSPAKRTEYHRVIEPLDKAGAYAAQDSGSMIIERIVGSTSNIIGLPMEETSAVLKGEFGIVPQKG